MATELTLKPFLKTLLGRTNGLEPEVQHSVGNAPPDFSTDLEKFVGSYTLAPGQRDEFGDRRTLQVTSNGSNALSFEQGRWDRGEIGPFGTDLPGRSWERSVFGALAEYRAGLSQPFSEVSADGNRVTWGEQQVENGGVRGALTWGLPTRTTESKSLVKDPDSGAVTLSNRRKAEELHPLKGWVVVADATDSKVYHPAQTE